MINNVTLTGRLTKDPDLRYSQSGTAFANSTIAVQRNFTNQQGEREADFIRLTASGKRAETFANYFHKGSLLGVTGEIRTGSYEKNGQKVYTTDVNVGQLIFLESKSQSSNNQQTSNQSQPANDPFAGNGKQVDIQDDSLPF
ncbi:single-stranded DNA-binding protein [Lactobacillus amylolyticus]|uniref:single-stranded DNA-binding protein n=1 Tax=Lactobacillus amylolyticus TaxID=83683 RepID=UPI00249381EC|nr:single-stranded DNA-binding protein [Lactobacillus amylolyticus]